MSTFSSCPKCAKPITVPRDAEPADMVRCPLCQAEYMLAEALANAPPELLVLRTLGVVSREESHDEPLSAGGTDLHLFDHASSDLSDGPTIDLSDSADLSDSPHANDDDDFAPKFDLDDEDTAPSHAAFRDADPEQTAMFEPAAQDTSAEREIAAERDTELEQAGTSPLSDSGFDFEAPTMSFDMSAAADEDVPHIADEHTHEEEVELSGFGDDPEDVPSLDMPADDDADMALAGAPHSEEAEELAAAPRRAGRKPSALIGLIFMATSLPVAAVGALAILWWAVGVDPLGLAPKLPSYLAFLAPKALASPPSRPANTQVAQVPPRAAPDDAPIPDLPTNVPPLTPRENGGQPVDPTAKPKRPAAMPDDADDAAEDTDDAVDTKPAAADDSVDDAMPDDAAGDDAMTDDSAADDDVPAKPPIRASAVPAKSPARASAGGAPADDDMAADDMAADDEPSETTDPAADAPTEMADDSTDAAPDSAMADDDTELAATEPADVPGSDVAAPEEDTEPAAPVGPRDAVQYSADDVEKGLTEARDAETALAGADKDALKKAKAQYYRKLYQLAELATFAENDAVEPEGDLGQIQQLLSEVAADRARFSEIGKAAGKWIAVSKGKEHQGVLLSGAVQSVAKQGQVYETKILLTDGAQVVSVLSAKKLPVGEGDQAVVLGSIVSDPTKTIDGYQGTETTAVWSGMAVKAPGAG